jgi:hypothetical protein
VATIIASHLPHVAVVIASVSGTICGAVGLALFA